MYSPEIFDEYTRRQYVAKVPTRNPFGEEEEPVKFNEMSIYTRIQVLQQLSIWTFGNVDRIRGLMPEDEDDLNWRMEPLGWDKDDRAYFVLDDNRLYRRSDEPVPPLSPVPKSKPKPKAKSKAAKKNVRPRTRGTRSSKRQKVEESEEEEEEEQEGHADVGAEDTVMDDTVVTDAEPSDVEPGYGFTSKTWELVAITLEEYQEFLANIFRSRDANEKQLRARIEEEVLPIIEKRAEAVRQKQLKKLRELENEAKMATAKRSSRLAGKAEREAQERAEREAEEKRLADLKMAREEQERQKRIEEVHSALMENVWSNANAKTRATSRGDSQESNVCASARPNVSCTKRSWPSWRLMRSAPALKMPIAMLLPMRNASPNGSESLRRSSTRRNWRSSQRKKETGSLTALSAVCTAKTWMTARIAWLVTNAAFGNTASVMASRLSRLRRTTSALSVPLASGKRRTRRSRRSLLSSLQTAVAAVLS
jgi:hypothetical protein